ncbi:MAG: outer membrane protein assembly factor BamA [Gammaproteobacteria bacterium]|jgi:outer membrane protein insertion porin family|nr:outer membrane protein assembly factor BamA [Gammaproteobacteria bacterium]
MRQSLVWLCALLLWSSVVVADTFTISDIRLQGLQRVSAGTVFNLLPVNVGDTVDEVAVRELIRILFDSGFFNDIRMARDDDVLVITVVERPAIESIEIEGNKAIKTEALLEGLGQQGLREGEIFKQATLERVGIELERQYVAQGRYGASIATDVEELPRNRVAIKIDIEEGKNSGIQHINIVGAEVFDQEALLEVLELQHPGLLSFYRNDDKYSREKLSGDLERLESYYKDRGYVEFDIESSQVSITPDRRQVYITLNVEEGQKYTVRDVNLVGELNDIRPEDLRRLFVVGPEQVFSQARVTATEERITQALGNSGYTFATASGVPKINDDGTVDVEFFVDAGKRAYVRRITFAGNTVTQDEVLRREMRQMEGGWASTAQIDLSKLRLERLGYFSEVNVETPAVPGTDDQIDVDFSVEEQPSSSISATLGYSQGFGLILGANYNANNVLGTGNTLGAGVSYSRFQRSANFSFFDPYYTLDGISRGFNVFARESNFDEANIARFTTNSYGAGVTFGFPIGETRRINFGGTIEYTDITEGRFPAQEISEFIDKNGNDALNYKLNLSWNSSTLNRGLFPTRGRSQSLAFEFAVPGSDLQFYKLTYQGQQYFPLGRGWTVRARTELGYGDGYGGTEGLPFYEHYFSGGFGSVRGFEQNTLGPRSTDPAIDLDGDGNPDPVFRRDPPPFGGNLLTEASLELIFPVPFVEQSNQFRPVLFVDAGNVFNTSCPEVSTICSDFDAGELRYSVGLSVTWITGLGPMTFGLAKPFNDDVFDETETFQFELGRTF